MWIFPRDLWTTSSDLVLKGLTLSIHLKTVEKCVNKGFTKHFTVC